MNHLKTAFIVICIGLSSFASAQDLLTGVPKKAEDYKATEPQVIATINWLEATPVTEQTDKRKQQSSLLVQWLMGSPSVTIELNAYIMDYCEKNTELLTAFMGGWTKYVLENNYSKDVFQGNLAGLKSLIKVYKAGGLKKDKKVQSLIKMEDEGKLEDWLKEQLK